MNSPRPGRIFDQYQHIDSVTSVSDVAVDPLQFALELLWREGHRSEDAETAGLADRHDDVATVREREYRYISTQALTDFSLHRTFPQNDFGHADDTSCCAVNIIACCSAATRSENSKTCCVINMPAPLFSAAGFSPRTGWEQSVRGGQRCNSEKTGAGRKTHA
jgi:hypothetical protein